MNDKQRELVKTARVAGIWYLLLAVSGILGFMVFHPQVYSSDPVETLTNLTDPDSLARLRLIFELLLVLSQALAALWFYRLFRSISDWKAWAVGIWGTINAVVIMISAISMAAAIQIANSSAQSYDDKMVLIALLGELIKHSWNIGGLFFGLWLIPMGHIVVTSKRWPLWLGRVLVLGGVGYIVSTLLYYAGVKHSLLDVLTIPATLGEFWMIGYLLIYGIRPGDEPEQ
ncbi:DUF4386 domain-containing protein [Robiginitalea marina]|uniref:DUF4386 domain-containing protein n=1 Tax=Robiginitalea marina TaxID=2954105 RepID=A0ABT1AWQ5_9FLAO|nr:DUF4386 domain-containing protein [Robiginitalea marina]MCO5724316.1 DUF4386 domain-containing protein [Robiginitalea marina]